MLLLLLFLILSCTFNEKKYSGKWSENWKPNSPRKLSPDRLTGITSYTDKLAGTRDPDCFLGMGTFWQKWVDFRGGGVISGISTPLFINIKNIFFTVNFRPRSIPRKAVGCPLGLSLVLKGGILINGDKRSRPLKTTVVQTRRLGIHRWQN